MGGVKGGGGVWILLHRSSFRVHWKSAARHDTWMPAAVIVVCFPWTNPSPASPQLYFS